MNRYQLMSRLTVVLISRRCFVGIHKWSMHRYHWTELSRICDRCLRCDDWHNTKKVWKERF